MPEKETEKEALWKQTRRINGLALGLVLAGAMIALVALVLTLPMASELMDDNHISTPDMPYKDRDNVTYSWTQKELWDLADRGTPYMLIGLGIMFSGVIALTIGISDRKFHKNYCKWQGDSKYCPECGFKMSRLEE